MGEWVQTSIVFDLDHTVGDIDHLIFRFRANNNTQQPSAYFIDDIEINELGFGNSYVVRTTSKYVCTAICLVHGTF